MTETKRYNGIMEYTICTDIFRNEVYIKMYNPWDILGHAGTTIQISMDDIEFIDQTLYDMYHTVLDRFGWLCCLPQSTSAVLSPFDLMND